MEFTNTFLFTSGILLCCSILAGIVSRRLGAPLLLVFLLVGIFFGVDGPGGIIFNDADLTYLVCSFALAVILFDGGLHTSMKDFHSVIRPSLLLATAGVLLTAGFVALGLYYFLGVSLLNALLVGSIVGSTDAAAVFLLLRQKGVKLQQRLCRTLEVESGINDPMAIFLTITCVELLLSKGTSEVWSQIPFNFLSQMGIGAAFGYAGGRGMLWLINKLELEIGLYPIFAFAACLLIFGATNILGGSGFLSVYIAGLLLGHEGYTSKKPVQQFIGGLAWLSQLIMLLMLGLLVTPSLLIYDFSFALVAALLLIFFARPLAVFISLAFSRFVWREKLFISWVGLRGGIPIYLAIIPVLMGVDGNFFNIAFIVVLISLLVQSWTIGPLARWLNLDETKKRR